jgi:hypothetical protein
MKTKFYRACMPVILFATSISLRAQTNIFPSTGSAGIGTTTPDASSLLEIKSTTKGLLISRMTKTQRDAIVSPATGLMIYQTNSNPGFYYYSGTAWKALSSKGWLLTGNAATDTALNFIGTTDANPLVFKVNNQRAAYLDFAPTSNTSFGYQSLSFNTTGTYNSAIGFSALDKNTSGYYNTVNGAYALYSNTTGVGNIANGAYALYSNISGGSNIASGTLALYNNTTGTANLALGFNALYSNTTASYNVALGYRSLYANTNGSNNIAEGYQALYSNTTGYSNVAIGVKALSTNQTAGNLVAVGDSSLYNSTGSSNTALGSKALYSNTTGFSNTAGGYKSLFSNSSGYGNVALGHSALYTNTTASKCVGIGDSALYKNSLSSASGNVAVGYKAGYFNTGVSNVFIGQEAGLNNSTGDSCTFIGYRAGLSNTTGSRNAFYGALAGNDNSTGHHNSFFGTLAGGTNSSGYSNSSFGAYAGIYNNGFGSSFFGTYAGYYNGFNSGAGSQNSMFGCEAGYNMFSGNENCVFGYRAGYSSTPTNDAYWNCFYGAMAGFSITSGDWNTLIGYQSGASITTGTGNVGLGSYTCGGGNNSHCTAVGQSAGSAGGGFDNAIAIGYSVYFSGSNEVRIGNNAITSIGGWANWSNVSDGRVKKNIKQNVPGLSFINKLQPITYNLNLDAADKILQHAEMKDKDGNTIQPSADEITATKEKQQIVYTGFIAQDVEKAAKELNYDFSGVDAAKNDKDLYGLRYSEFVVPLVKAVQELSSQNSELKSQNADLEKKYEEQQKQIDELKAIVFAGSQSAVSMQHVTINEKPETASLSQNIPNPFNRATTINYTLPQQFSSARIIITDKAGKVLKDVNVSRSGKGSLKVDASTLSSGAYQYSLYLDSRLIDTKQMILTK